MLTLRDFPEMAPWQIVRARYRHRRAMWRAVRYAGIVTLVCAVVGWAPWQAWFL